MGRDMINKWVNFVLTYLTRNQHEETGYRIFLIKINVIYVRINTYMSIVSIFESYIHI